MARYWIIAIILAAIGCYKGCQAQVRSFGRLLNPTDVYPSNFINSSVGSVYVFAEPIIHRGIVMSVRGYFAREGDVTFQVWRPVTPGNVARLRLVRTMSFTVQAPDVDTLTQYTTLSLSPCVVVQSGDLVGVYVSEIPSSFIIAYDIPDGKSLRMGTPFASPPSVGDEAVFDGIVFPISASMEARVYLGDYNNGTSADCSIVPQLRTLLDSLDVTQAPDTTVTVPTVQKGEKGDPGATGPAGATGATGATGARGPIGPIGPQGRQGPTGISGTPGLNGSNGAKGQKGDPGLAGSQGSRGAKGDAGSKGSKGDSGSKGTDGVQGSTGSQGEKGSPGPRGLPGSPGSPGDGSPGSQGEKGSPGPPGPQGSPGPQALQGENGISGPPGPPGPQGASGAPAVQIDPVKNQSGASSGASSENNASLVLNETVIVVLIVWNILLTIAIIILIVVVVLHRKSTRANRVMAKYGSSSSDSNGVKAIMRNIDPSEIDARNW